MEIITHKRGIFEVFKYTSLFLMLLLSGECNKAGPEIRETETEVFAIVGQDTISALQFKESYQTAIMRTSVNDNLENRKYHLYKMAEGFLLAQAAQDAQLDTLSYFRQRKELIEREVMRQYYFDEIESDIEIDEADLKEAFRRSRETRLVRHLFSRDKEKIERMYARLKRDNSDFYALAHKSFTDSTLQNNGGLLGWVSWGDTDLRFEDVMYSMEENQISEPFKSAYGWHILKVEKIKREILPTQLEYDQFVAKNRKKLVRIYKEEKLSGYLNKFMQNQDLELNIPLLRTISQELKDKYKYYFLGKDQKLNKLPPENVEALALALEDLLNETLVKYDGGEWKVEDYLNRLPELPANFILTDIEKSVALALRNDLLARQAYKQGLHKKREVREKVELRCYELLARLKSHQLHQSIPLEDRLNWTAEDSRLYRMQQWRLKKAKFLEKKRDKTKIRFYYDKLESLYSNT